MFANIFNKIKKEEVNKVKEIFPEANNVKFKNLNGSFHKNILATFNKRKIVIRSLHKNISHKKEEIKNERKIMQTIKFPLIPKIIGGGEDFIIYEYVQGKRLLPGAKNGDLYARDIAKVLAKLQNLKIQKNLKIKNETIEQRLEKYKEILKSRGIFNETFETTYNWLKLNSYKINNYVLCHGDFKSTNMIGYNGSIASLIDWEHARLSSIYEDLGWFTAICWRGKYINRGASGISNTNTFLREYENAKKIKINQQKLEYWQMFSYLKAVTLYSSCHKDTNVYHSLSKISEFWFIIELNAICLNALHKAGKQNSINIEYSEFNFAELEMPSFFSYLKSSFLSLLEVIKINYSFNSWLHQNGKILKIYYRQLKHGKIKEIKNEKAVFHNGFIASGIKYNNT